jgi:hypothetical protein
MRWLIDRSIRRSTRRSHARSVSNCWVVAISLCVPPFVACTHLTRHTQSLRSLIRQKNRLACAQANKPVTSDPCEPESFVHSS